jgi:NAD(P)-dependent dehydrogenase (short-subunit alcohol dehydrogenase family)
VGDIPAEGPRQQRHREEEEQLMPSILVTGVSSGMGRAVANLYAKRGYTVIGTVLDPATPVEGLDARVTLEPLDLGRKGDGAELAQRVLQKYGCPDVVLNNAGIVQFGAIEDVSAAELERIFQINFFGQLELTRGLLPAMRERRSGTLANTTSLGGTLTFPFFGAYNATKWAFEGACEGLWHELKPFGIRVKAIEPGYVQTAIWSTALPKAGVEAPEADLKGSAAYHPFMRAMLKFEAAITNRTSPEDAAAEIAAAIDDPSDRLRYPVAAYARPIVRARRVLGPQAMMRFFHKRWMGPDAG